MLAVLVGFVSASALADELRINDIDVYLNDDDDALDDVDEMGGDIDDLEPGDELKFEVEVENTYDDLTIEGVVLEAYIENIDDGDDVSEESSDYDIEANDSKIKTVTLEIPSNAKTGDYKLYVRAYGQDEDGYDQDDIVDFGISVKGTAAYLVNFTQVSVNPSSLPCGSSGIASATVQNYGSYSESVVLTFSSPAFGLSQTTSFSLSPDQSMTKEATVRIPTTLAQGSYDVTVTASSSGRIEMRKYTVAVYGNCAAGSSASSTAANQQTGLAPVPISKISAGTTTEDLLIIILGVGGALVVFAIVLGLIVVLVKQR